MGRLSLSSQVSYQQGSLSERFAASLLATEDGETSVQSVTTSAVQLTFNPVSSRDVVSVINLDSENFVEIGLSVSATFHPLVKLMPGEVAILPVDDATDVYAKADTAAVRVKMYYGARPVVEE